MRKMSFIDSVFLFYFVFLVDFCMPDDALESKRLLVNDPEFVLKELNSMKSEITDLKSKVTTLTASNKILQDSLVAVENGKDGATYIRWGREQCAGNMTELVYTGFGAGSWFDHTGTATNYLCMPNDPLWDLYNDVADTYRGYVYGMEYEHLGFSSNLHDENAPCAVCRAKASTVLMIPGRNKCYPGWNMEYHGYLVSGWSGHKASTQYICLDASPEVLYAGHNNENGAVLFSVEGICGSLPCPPYVNHRELTCVVCSK